MNKPINEEDKGFSFQQYVEWAFEQNKDTYKYAEKNQLEQTNLVTSQIQDDQIQNITWLFRKCHSETDLKKQNSAFLELQHIIRHIFKFLLVLVSKNQDEKQIITLMNSLGILEKDNVLQVCIADPNINILTQKYSHQTISNQGNQILKNFRVIIEKWSELKDAKLEALRPDSDYAFLEEFQRINVCLNMDQMNIISKKKKEKEREKQKIQQEKENIQQMRLFQSSLRKEKIHEMKIVKIDCKKSKQSLFLQPNGNIVKGMIWFPFNIPNLCPLWLSTDFEILSFCNNNNLNSDLRQQCGFISYKGPVNDYFEPHTYDFDIGTEGILQTLSDTNTYSGGFKNGLFDGKNKQYSQGTLIYYGGFKNGQKHGEGFYLESQNEQLYMRGQYESNLKQGLFVDYKLEPKKSNIFFSKNEKKQEYYKNGIKYEKIPTDVKQQNVSQNPSCNLLNFNDYGINNFQLASLRPGGWINSSVIDILLGQIISMVEYSNLTHQNNVMPKMKAFFINCSQFQDIFGSMITKDEKINHSVFKQLQDQQSNQNNYYKNIENNIRIVFYFNLDRSHFLSAVYENQKLYLIDSLKDERKAVTFQMVQFLQFLGFNVQEQYNNCKISQQQNSYDCGVYTIYYVSQIIKHQHLTIQEMFEKKCFEIAQHQINYLRYLIYQNLIGNGASIMEL